MPSDPAIYSEWLSTSVDAAWASSTTDPQWIGAESPSVVYEFAPVVSIPFDAAPAYSASFARAPIAVVQASSSADTSYCRSFDRAIPVGVSCVESFCRTRTHSALCPIAISALSQFSGPGFDFSPVVEIGLVASPSNSRLFSPSPVVGIGLVASASNSRLFSPSPVVSASVSASSSRSASFAPSTLALIQFSAFSSFEHVTSSAAEFAPVAVISLTASCDVVFSPVSVYAHAPTALIGLSVLSSRSTARAFRPVAVVPLSALATSGRCRVYEHAADAPLPLVAAGALSRGRSFEAHTALPLVGLGQSLFVFAYAPIVPAHISCVADVIGLIAINLDFDSIVVSVDVNGFVVSLEETFEIVELPSSVSTGTSLSSRLSRLIDLDSFVTRDFSSLPANTSPLPYPSGRATFNSSIARNFVSSSAVCTGVQLNSMTLH